MDKREKWIVSTLVICAFGIGILWGYRFGIDEISGMLNSCINNYNSLLNANVVGGIING